jgi:hypothetical protein
MQKTLDDKIAFHKYVSIFVLALIAAFVAYIFWKLMLPRKDFYNELWAPVYLLVRGQSPYNTASLDPNLPAAWLPMVIGFFFPLGWLSENSALVFWYIFNILEICAIVYLVQGQKINLFNTIAVALLCFFFPLTLNHINLGQFSITVMLCWILAIYFYTQGGVPAAEHGDGSGWIYKWISTFLIALALSKPHLGLLAMLGLSYHETTRGGLRAMFTLWMRTGIACLVLCIPLFIAYPNWIPDMFIAMGKNPSWSYPSLFILYYRFVPALQYPLWVLTVLSALAANFWLWKKLPMQNALYWSLALAPFVTHYVGSWDFVIVLPLFIFTYINVDWKRKIFLWVIYLIAWGLMARIQMMVPSHNHYFWWVPLWFIGASALVTWKNVPKAS